ncbi:MAG: glycosyltransferase [Acidimicrobiales bacterium]
MPDHRPSCLVFDLYLDSLGGGEAVVLACAEELRSTHCVVVAGPTLPPPGTIVGRGWPQPRDLRRLTAGRFTAASARFDLVVYLANGPPLPSLARRSIGILQFPMRALSPNPLRRAVERSGLRRYEWVVYSDFVAKWARSRYRIDPIVLHPPVRLGPPNAAKDGDRSRVILSIGRFFGVQHSKRQDALVAAFRQIPPEERRGWELVLVGGVGSSPADRLYLDRLRSAAAGLPVRFAVDVDRPALEAELARASIYWHATGFERRPEAPEHAEHFGISVVEAMSWGAVPLVHDDGGPPEVVADTGLTWRSLGELVAQTTTLIRDPLRRQALAARARERSQAYGEPVFRSRFRQLVDLGSGTAGRGRRRRPPSASG